MKKSKIKVVTIIGTRPEIIRLSRVMRLLDKHVNHIIIHTGQNYDYELNEIFFEDLELRLPDYFLNVNTKSLGNLLGETIIKSEEILLKEKPDAVLILGDTNSSIAAIISKRYKIPIFHMEAGNRSFDSNVPEEINRKIIDHISDFNLVYTEHARRHLLDEGIPHRNIFVTGSPMYEVLKYYKNKIVQSKILRELKIQQRKYFLVSVHREENVDYEYNLNEILHVLNSLVEDYNIPIIVSTHPRTKKRIKEFRKTTLNNLIHFLQPFSFSDYVHLQLNALCTISDSGTISEESAILSFPAITIRNSMERPEAMDAGTIILSGVNNQIVLESIQLAIEEHKNKVIKKIPDEYKIEDASWRVLKLILGLTNLSHIWSNIYK